MGFIPSIKIDRHQMLDLWGVGLQFFVVYNAAQELTGLQVSVSLFDKTTDIGLIWL
jgi:hypothetical protein